MEYEEYDGVCWYGLWWYMVILNYLDISFMMDHDGGGYEIIVIFFAVESTDDINAVTKW